MKGKTPWPIKHCSKSTNTSFSNQDRSFPSTIPLIIEILCSLFTLLSTFFQFFFKFFFDVFFVFHFVFRYRTNCFKNLREIEWKWREKKTKEEKEGWEKTKIMRQQARKNNQVKKPLSDCFSSQFDWCFFQSVSTYSTKSSACSLHFQQYHFTYHLGKIS